MKLWHMIKENFRKALIVLGFTATAIAGIILFNSGERNFLTWDESQALIRQYNLQLKIIRENCENDIRCTTINGQKVVIFEGIKSKKDIPKKINEWIGKGNAAYIK